MKIKGIPIWEQYLEYIVLGVAVLVFLGFTVMQFIGNPNAVEDARMGTIAPGEVDGILDKEAARLRPFFEPGADPQVVVPKPEPVANVFQARLSARISPQQPYLVAQRENPVVASAANLPTDVRFVEPQIPAPHTVVASQYFDALPPEVVQEHETLAQMIPAAPYDISWITAAATFDSAAVLAEYRRTGMDGEPAPVPLSWYADKVTMIDVLIEREEQVDDHWTDLTTIEPIPGQFTIRVDIEGSKLTGGDRDALVQRFAQSPLMLQIIQPEFYATRNSSWFPPTTQIEQEEVDRTMTPEERRAIQLQAQLKNSSRELARVEQLLEEAGGELYDDGRKPGGGGTPGGSTGGGAPPKAPPGGGAAGGGGDMKRRGAENDSKQADAQRRTLTKKRDVLRKDVARFEKDLEAIGEQADVEVAVENTDPLAGDSVRIWGHDLDVEPGHVYRYRFTVRLLNPYFKHEIHLIDDQKHLANSIYVASKTSEWSRPIIAKPPLETFVVSANAVDTMNVNVGNLGNNAPGRLGLGQTAVEVFRFYDGRWWRERFMVEPGERVGDRKSVRLPDSGNVEIDFGTDWYVVDIVADLNADPNADRGRAATVLLKSITLPGMSMWRHPSFDAENFRRNELDDLVRNAEGSSTQANAGGTTPAN